MHEQTDVAVVGFSLPALSGEEGLRIVAGVMAL